MHCSNEIYDFQPLLGKSQHMQYESQEGSFVSWLISLPKEGPPGALHQWNGAPVLVQLKIECQVQYNFISLKQLQILLLK